MRPGLAMLFLLNLTQLVLLGCPGPQPLPPAPKAANVAFNLWCDATTEHGQDEIYYIIAAKLSNGTTITNRLPGPTGHWDINDGKPPRNINDVLLQPVSLLPGESASILVTIMEEDGGTSKTWQEIATGLLVLIPDPTGISEAAAGVLEFLGQFLIIQDPDDFIGSYQILLRNESGTITTQWFPLSGVSENIPGGGGPGTHGFRFNGSKTNYFGWGKLVP